LNPVQDCHELTIGHSIELVWLKSLFLHRLNSWVWSAFQIATHFPRLHLNPGQNFTEMKERFSVEQGGLAGMFNPTGCGSQKGLRLSFGFHSHEPYRYWPAV
jgi:hypothetical protein